MARFHAIDTKTAKVTDIAQVLPELTPDHMLPEPDALVEDAGLYEPVDGSLSQDLIPLRQADDRST